jgi:shikimate dehydrogenase
MMRKFGLIGFPLSHSFSRNYFTNKFAAEGIRDCEYHLFPLKSINEITHLISENSTLCGLNVTIPYKESVLPFLHAVSPAVKQIGACNCIKIVKGHLEGYNTDVVGFEESIKPFLKPEISKALILGTGGAAKAVAWVLKKLSIDFQYVSRKSSEGILSYNDISSTVLKEIPLIINTTPLGMQPNIFNKPSLPYGVIAPGHLCYDLIYNPEKTSFLAACEAEGAVIKNGLEMLEIQAEESWRIWND